eukprot:scaffold900_cov430-Prasinococcus_capsulatus_cf.AAC.6
MDSAPLGVAEHLRRFLPCRSQLSYKLNSITARGRTAEHTCPHATGQVPAQLEAGFALPAVTRARSCYRYEAAVAGCGSFGADAGAKNPDRTLKGSDWPVACEEP